nr:hypothetical protein [Enterococcus sp. CSURQ0835]
MFYWKDSNDNQCIGKEHLLWVPNFCENSYFTKMQNIFWPSPSLNYYKNGKDLGFYSRCRTRAILKDTQFLAEGKEVCEWVKENALEDYLLSDYERGIDI